MSIKEIISAAIPDRPLLTPPEFCDIARIKEQTAAALRMQKRGPAFIRVGRSIRYPRQAIIDWLTSQAVTTSTPVEA